MTTTAHGCALLDAAADLIRRGLPIIPVGGDDGKNPDINGKGWHKRSYTVDDFAAAWRGQSKPGIGIKLGPDCVIDIEADSEDEEQLFTKLFEGCDPPLTPTYRSARGKHRLFRFNDRLRGTDRAVVNFCNGGTAKLGIRIGADGKGAQSVIPPSADRTWLVSWDDVEPAPLPDLVVERILAAADPQKPAGKIPQGSGDTRKKVGAAALDAMLRIHPKPGESDSSNRLLAVCCRAVEHDLDDTVAVATIRQYEKTHPFAADWPDDDIVRRLRDAERKTERGSIISGKPTIDTSVKDLSIITPLAWEAIEHANEPPTMFRYGGVASRIETGDEGEPIIKPLDFHRMRHQMALAATWVEYRRSGEEMQERPTAPPKDVVNDVLATPNQPLPKLTRIVECPVFASDGSLQTTPGYHPRSQTYYAPAKGLIVQDVPQHPEGIDLESARILICEELLGEFPFVDQAELAHALALLLLPLARDLIDGPTPLHLFEKPSPGTGATLLVDMLAMPATGRPTPTMTEGRDEDEWRKRVTAKLRSGAIFLFIDNLRRRLDSAAVSAGITSTTWEDRVLGVSEMTRLPVRCAWVATGNNPALSTEIARRTVRIRMDAKQDRPWLRDGFKHENLRQWASEHRGELVWAALTMIQAWIAAGRPSGKVKLGMFERWSEVMGGILDVAGVPGFLTNLADFYEQSDAEGASWRAFLGEWWEKFTDQEMTVKDLWPIASGDACLPLGDKGEQSQKIVLGKMLGEKRDRVFDIDLGKQHKRLMLARGGQFRRAYQWQLKDVSV